MERLKQILKETKIKNYLKKYKVEQLKLFGSFLHGDQNTDSDIDFLVRFSADAKSTLLDRARLKLLLESILNREVDLIREDSVDRYLKDQILQEAEIVYEKAE